MENTTEKMLKKQDNFRCGFLWADLEMSGLDVSRDVILEVAVMGSDPKLQQLVEGPTFVIKQPVETLEQMDSWCKKQHQASGLWEQVLQSNITIEFAEQEIVAFVKKHCTDKQLLLAGNTIYQDRIFIQRYMPNLATLLHYRMIDVSTVKELVKAWYPNHPEAKFKKSKNHRALEDIVESVNELRHYRKYFWQ